MVRYDHIFLILIVFQPISLEVTYQNLFALVLYHPHIPYNNVIIGQKSHKTYQ